MFSVKKPTTEVPMPRRDNIRQWSGGPRLPFEQDPPDPEQLALLKAILDRPDPPIKVPVTPSKPTPQVTTTSLGSESGVTLATKIEADGQIIFDLPPAKI